MRHARRDARPLPGPAVWWIARSTPACGLLAAAGLQRLACLLFGARACAPVALGLGAGIWSMAAVHSHQQVWFNALTDRSTPGALAARYELDVGPKEVVYRRGASLLPLREQTATAAGGSSCPTLTHG